MFVGHLFFVGMTCVVPKSSRNPEKTGEEMRKFSGFPEKCPKNG